MSYPRLDFHDNSRHGQWDEDFWSMLLSGGLLILMLVAAIAMWRSTTTLQTTTLFEKATQETTRPTLPTVPY